MAKQITSGSNKELKNLLSKAKGAPLPFDVVPMLATLVDKPFDEPGWIYEVKWDGYRALAYLSKGAVELRSRNNKSFNEKFYSIHSALKQWKINAVLDGEIIVVNDKGISNFGSLQTWRSEADGELVFYLFDVLWLEGHDLMEMTLTDRKEILKIICPHTNIIRLSESFDSGTEEFLRSAKKMNLEGIIAKKTGSHYLPGSRSKEWLKIKIGKRQEVVIGGYTNNAGSKKPFSALLVGVNNNGKIEYTGKIGTGFSKKQQLEMMEQFKPFVIKKCPFTYEPDINKPSRFRPDPPIATATWLLPELICEVSYAEMTSDNIMRHPSFQGMREDKSPTDVVRETETPTDEVVKSQNKKLSARLFKTSTGQARKTLLNPKDESQVRIVNGHEIKFNNLSKIYFPKGKVTKRDVINYYYQVAPFMVPYMIDRPQTLIRYPNGIDGESFYQKDVTGKVPSWIKQFPYFSEKGGNRNFMVCTDEASLLYIASIGGIEMHPWSSRAQKPDNPDWCIIDLDPDKNTFEQVIKAAQVTKQILDAIDVPSYCKTSGSTGLHIYIPLGAKYSYEDSKEFARIIAKIIHAQIPAFTSIERLTANRDGKMYIDFLQNRPQATLAAPYSLRPKKDATVSMPLHWEEVKKGLKMQHFTISTAVARLTEEGDIFKGVLGKGINLKQTLAKIKSVFTL